VWRVAVNGYPYQSLETLGVSSNEYAFQATKMAIYCVLGQSHLENFYANDDIGQSIVNLIHRLVNIGLNGTDTYKTPIASINKSGEMILDGDYYIQNYNVSCNVEVSSYSIEKVGFPNGTIITNSVGEEKTSFGQGETFQLKIPKNIVETEDINGRLIAKVNAKSYALFYSTNYNPNLQDYATTADIVELTNSAVDINLKANTASIKIRKIDTDTKQPIKDTTYELIKEDGTVLSIGTTDENGSIIVTTSPIYIKGLDNRIYYQAISNVVKNRYEVFKEKFSEEISLIDGLATKIDNLKYYSEQLNNIVDSIPENEAIIKMN